MLAMPTQKTYNGGAKGRKQELLDLDTLMSTPAGSRFIWRLLTLSGVFRSSFSSDALVMAMNEGQRNLGLRLLGDVMEACPDKYLKHLVAWQALRFKINEGVET
jgi:hypothetical protein